MRIESIYTSRVIGEVDADIRIDDIPVDATKHSMIRLHRPGFPDINEEEIVNTVTRGAGVVLEQFIETGHNRYVIYDRFNDLNVVVAVRGAHRGPVEFTVITVIKKPDFVPSPGTVKVEV